MRSEVKKFIPLLVVILILNVFLVVNLGAKGNSSIDGFAGSKAEDNNSNIMSSTYWTNFSFIHIN